MFSGVSPLLLVERRDSRECSALKLSIQRFQPAERASGFAAFLFLCGMFQHPEHVNSGGDISRLFPVLPPERRGGSGECRALKLPIQSFQPVESSSGFAAETHGGGKKCGAHHAEWFSLAGLQQPCCASPHRAAPSVHPAARFQQSKPPQTGTAFPYILILQSSYSNVPAP